MAEMVDGKCDLEQLEIDRVSCFSLNFNWTIEYCNSGSLHNRESSKINLPGSIWHFVIKIESLKHVDRSITADRCAPKQTNKQTRFLKRESIYVSMEEGMRVSVCGTIKINKISYKINDIWVTGHPILSESFLFFVTEYTVCQMHFNLKIYGLETLDKITLTQHHRDSKNMEGECLKNFPKNFKTLWKNPQLSDFRIQVDKEIIPTHKIVLFARSPVFARMFLNPTDESKEDLSVVKDVSFETMERFLGFLYGHFPDMEALQDLEELCELYYVSDKYEVLDLRDWCSRVMIERITTENVFRMFDLFDSHSDAACLKLVEDYCFVHLKAIVKPDEWEAIVQKNPKFAFKMLGRMSKCF